VLDAMPHVFTSLSTKYHDRRSPRTPPSAHWSDQSVDCLLREHLLPASAAT
jgi:hypothetical protein